MRDRLAVGSQQQSDHGFHVSVSVGSASNARDQQSFESGRTINGPFVPLAWATPVLGPDLHLNLYCTIFPKTHLITAGSVCVSRYRFVGY